MSKQKHEPMAQHNRNCGPRKYKSPHHAKAMRGLGNEPGLS
jgi:hypothetical protein